MIGCNIQTIRLNKKLSRNELAKKIGVSQQFIQQMETGQKCPSLDTALRLAAALGCKLDDLVEATGEKDKESGKMVK